MDIQNILLQVKSGEMSLETAEQMLEKIPYEDLGYAKLDHHRRIRSGFGEVVFCSGKATDHLVGIYQHFTSRTAVSWAQEPERTSILL